MAATGSEVDWWSIAHAASFPIKYTIESMVYCSHTAISRKVVGKSARNNPEKYCGWFWVHCSSKKYERMAREAMDMSLRVLKESNKRRFDSTMSWTVYWSYPILPFGVVVANFFSDNLSQNSCIPNMVSARWLRRISWGDWRQSEMAKYFEWTIYRINLYVQVRNELIKQTLQLINCTFWIIFQICYFQIWQTVSPHRYQSDICTPAPRSP